jgi:hypothetical protein
LGQKRDLVCFMCLKFEQYRYSENKLANNCSYLRAEQKNGAEGSRTPDLLTASQAFSQLNYGPIKIELSIYFKQR